MKLKNNLFTISSCEPTDKGVSYHIHLNSECVIYKAHFPEQPVTPGVCIVEMAHELLEEYMQCPLAVRVVKNIKFLTIISPLLVQDIIYVLTINEEEDGVVKLQASVISAETVYAKISLVCQK